MIEQEVQSNVWGRYHIGSISSSVLKRPKISKKRPGVVHPQLLLSLGTQILQKYSILQDLT